MSRAERAVVAVLAYSAQFHHPLTIKEITERMLTLQGLQTIDPDFFGKQAIFQSKAAAEGQITSALRSLLKQKRVLQKGAFFTLSGESAAFKKRAASEAIQREKQALITELTDLAAKIPWITGIAITGSHAAGGAAAADDVDFLVVTQNKRLWLARLWLLFHSWRRGRRPHVPGGDISHSWDLNFWLDETRLALPVQKHTVYEAYEILQTQWVFQRHQVYDRFLQKNPWIAQYLCFPPKPANRTSTQTSSDSLFLTALNALAFFIQVGYRTLRHGQQRADTHSAFFHPARTKESIFLAWKSRYLKALGEKIVLVTGVFDVLHQEHRNFLMAAREAGDKLFIGLESDVRVRKLKGPGRPVNSQQQRKKNLEQWQLADEVCILPDAFRSAERGQFIDRLRPDVLAVSSHSPHLEDKRRVMKQYGGTLKVVYRHHPGISTTALLRQQQ